MPKLALGALLLSAALGCVNVSRADAPPLWEVHGAEGDGTMLLLGSIHFGSTAMYPLAAEITEGFERAEVLVVELDLAALEQARSSQLVVQRGTLPPGDHLRRHLSEETWLALRRAAGNLGLESADLSRYRPWLLGALLTSVSLRRLGYVEELGVDRFFLERAGGRTVLALETLEQQLELLESLPAGEADRFLAEALEELGDGAYFASLIEAWRAGEAEELDRLINVRFAHSPEGRQARAALLDDRSRAMAAKLVQRMRSRPPRRYFVVTGVGHMVGSGGIVAELRRAGFVVERRSISE